MVLVMSSNMRSLSTVDKPATLFCTVSGITSRPGGRRFQLYVLSAWRRKPFVVGPEVGDFDPIFDKLPANAKVSGNLLRRSAGRDESPQRRIRDQRGRAYRIGCLFIIVIVITGQDPLVATLGS